MDLEFVIKKEFGRSLYYPQDRLGLKLLSLLTPAKAKVRRKSFSVEQIAILASCVEFNIKSEKENKNERD